MDTDLKPYYVLSIFIEPTVCNSLTVTKYKNNIYDVQNKVDLYKSSASNELSSYMDAGFDLFVPNSININSQSYSNKIDHGIKCAMTLNGVPTAFYLYPRSSTGSKTPLRLSNSVGIIDSGYRGNIIAIFDNMSCNNYNVSSNDRLTQICGPNIMYPIWPVLVDNVEELGTTSRGDGGFGSTG
jgi:dUTP pyrophosphatase